MFTMHNLVQQVRRFQPLSWTKTFPWREWLFVGIPVAIAVLVALWIAAKFLDASPPKRVVLATGPEGSAYQSFGETYRKVFEREGVTLELLPTKGARENYKFLRGPLAAGANGANGNGNGSNGSTPTAGTGTATGTVAGASASGSAAAPAKPEEPMPHVDAAFVRGGIGTGEEAPRIVSLGTVAYEALWVFCNGEKTMDDLPPLQGKTVAIGGKGAGMRRMVRNLLKYNGVDETEFKSLDLGGIEAAEALLAGQAECIFLMEPPEAGILKALIFARGAQIVDFERRADAYIKKLPFLQKVILPEGGLDMPANVPPRPLTLLAAQTQILASEDLHPAIQMLLLQAAKEAHGAVGLFNRQGELPVPNRFDFPISEHADRFFERGRPFLQRYLPFWLANLVDRAIVVLIPAFAIVFPLARLLPPLYAWRMRRRIYRWYGELMFIENEMRRTLTKGETRDFGERLEWIEQEVRELKTPPAYANQLYSLLQHIDFVQHKLEQIVATTATGKHEIPPFAAS